MDKFWEVINGQQPEESARERQVALFGDLYFTPKEKFGDIDLSEIRIEDLKALYDAMANMPTIEDSVLVSDLSRPQLSIFAEAFVRKNAIKHTWMVNSQQLKKRFF